MSSTLLPVVSRLPQSTAGSACTDTGATSLPLLLNGGMVELGHAVKHATDGTDPCDPPRIGRNVLLLAIIPIHL